MDGTGVLLEAFSEELGRVHVVTYPRDELLDYRALEERVLRELPADGPFVLLGESFSSPLAMRIAARAPRGLVALVLVAGFARAPRPFLPLVPALLFRMGLPAFVARLVLLGSDAPADAVHVLRTRLASVRPEVLKARLAAIAAVDARDALRRCPVPVLALVGKSDRLVPASVLAELRRARPDLAVERLAAPHLLLQRAPREAARAIRDFVAQVGAAT